MNMNPGLILEGIKPGQAIYDAVFAGELSQPIGTAPSWEQYLPTFEAQNWLPFCIAFSLNNILETLARANGQDLNFSDRELAVNSNTSKVGNYLSVVAERARVIGMVKEEDCPFTPEMLNNPDFNNTWPQVFSLPFLSDKMRFKLDSYSWVLGGAEAIRSALNFGPLTIAIPIGGQDYYRSGVVPAPAQIFAWHAVELYWLDDNNQYHIYDSFLPAKKTLSSNYPVPSVMSYRALPENWKENNMSITGYFKSKDGKTYGGYVLFESVEVMKGFRAITGLPLPLNPDGSPNWAEINKVAKDSKDL